MEDRLVDVDTLQLVSRLLVSMRDGTMKDTDWNDVNVAITDVRDLIGGKSRKSSTGDDKCYAAFVEMVDVHRRELPVNSAVDTIETLTNKASQMVSEDNEWYSNHLIESSLSLYVDDVYVGPVDEH